MVLCYQTFSHFFSSPFAVQRPLDIKNRPRIPIPDEDPYSIAGNGDGSGGSSGSSGFGTSNNVSGVYKNCFYPNFKHFFRLETRAETLSFDDTKMKTHWNTLS